MSAKHSPKRYKCDACGYIGIQTTNHFKPTWSHGRYNVCPMCPPWKKYPEFGGMTNRWLDLFDKTKQTIMA